MTYKVVDPSVLLKNCLEFFNNDELAAQVWMSKYALKNPKGEYVEESPKDRFYAIAKELERIDKKYLPNANTADGYYDYMVSKKIMPGGSNLFGIANPFALSSLANCFVMSLNNEDSYGSILRTDQELVHIAKRRGGVGMDISALRPASDAVSNAAGSSTGSVSFIPRYSNTTREVAQNGRRGALMLTESINHPDAPRFIGLKLDKVTATGANLSLRITDEFMQAVECDGQHIFRFPVDASRDDKTAFRGKTSARALWKVIMAAAWTSAEPGVIFWDRVKSESPADCYPQYQTESTNPCGEIPLSPYDSCRLLSISLPQFVKDPFTENAVFDFQAYYSACFVATRMMDNIIDLELEKIQSIINKIIADPESYETKAIELALWRKIQKACIEGRRAGISSIGHGDMLAMMGVRYGSEMGNNVCAYYQEISARLIYSASIDLAIERGAFPAFNYELEKDNPFIKRLGTDTNNRLAKHGRRNIALLTIPPSGSLSIILDNQTSGIEPVFELFYKRKRKVNAGDPGVTFIDATGDHFQEYIVMHPGFKQWFYAQGYTGLETLSMSSLETFAKASPYHLATSSTIDPLAKIDLQGKLQKYIDHSISVTHNLPENVTLDEVSKIYFAAWKSGCKGCTVYRDGSRDGILNSTSTLSDEAFDYKDSPKRPKKLECEIFYPTIRGEQCVVIVGLRNKKPFEVFGFKGTLDISQTIHKGIMQKQKSGVYHLLDEKSNMLVEDIGAKFDFPEWNSTTRLLSWGLRHGGDITFAVEQLNKSEGVITDAAKVLARVLKKYTKLDRKQDSAPCPVCGGEMRYEGGCPTCHSCGYSKCG